MAGGRGSPPPESARAIARAHSYGTQPAEVGPTFAAQETAGMPLGASAVERPAGDATGGRSALARMFRRVWKPALKFNTTDSEFLRQLHDIRLATKRLIKNADADVVLEVLRSLKDIGRPPLLVNDTLPMSPWHPTDGNISLNEDCPTWRSVLDSLVKPRYGVVVHEATARRRADGGWVIPLQAWLFRRNEGRHAIRIALVQKLLIEGKHGIKNIDAEAQHIYEERARLIFRSLVFRGGEVDRRLQVRLGKTEPWYTLPVKTDGHGRVDLDLFLSDEDASRLADTEGMVTIEVRSTVPRAAEAGSAAGVADDETAGRAVGVASARLAEAFGITVISDLDDTVKVTNVHAGEGTIVRNTFFEKFRAVQGMAELFQQWAKAMPGTTFHFVSNSPPELYEPLQAFLRDEGFPLAPLHLRPLWGKGKKGFKETTLNRLIAENPQRRFVLVGDSGERDPLIYAEMFREYPDQVWKVLIREVDPSRPVNGSIFEGMSDTRWQVFREPSEVTLET